MILPGSTLGMLGGGQLGKMFTVAAQTMGYRVVVLDPDLRSPAGSIADEHLCAGFSDPQALRRMADLCQVVTIEFENIPAQALRDLSSEVPVYPSASAVEIAQNRIREKTYIRKIGLKTAEFAVLEKAGDIDGIDPGFVFPAILKVAEFGYDGKGQIAVGSLTEVSAAFESLGCVACVLEQRIDLALEVSVILARGEGQAPLAFPVAENEHRAGILHQTMVPASLPAALQQQAQAQAVKLAEALDYHGVLAVEFFVTGDGELLINEMAPRTHNSGHYTLDACITSQFEQQVRAICGLPFGDVRLLSPVAMINLLGDLWADGAPDWMQLLSNPAAKLHLYGKHEPRPGRKMGHFCLLDDSVEVLRQRPEQIFQALT
jgi:5-(carboxyamino)imidazole ribonucleotide synthase